MTYDPTIPQASDNISTSQGEILTNFSQIGSLFGSNAAADHYAFNDATAAFRALHKQVTFPTPLGAAPAPSNPKGIIYPLADVNDTSTRTQTYFKNGSTTHQLTNRFSAAAAPGWIMLSGSKDSIIFMWGTEASITIGTHTVNFPQITNHVSGPGFPTSCFNVQFSLSCTSSNPANVPSVVINDGSISASQFQYRVNTTLPDVDLFWFAIGV